MVVALFVYQAECSCLESGNGNGSKQLPETIREKNEGRGEN
jgi:hypothetical protein